MNDEVERLAVWSRSGWLQLGFVQLLPSWRNINLRLTGAMVAFAD